VWEPPINFVVFLQTGKEDVEKEDMRLFMVEIGNAHVIVYELNREHAKRAAQRWLFDDRERYIVTPLTKPGDRIHFDFSLSV
jgi:hypothetical protein